MVPSWAEKPSDTQGTKAWHNWRAKGIGASEGPVIMGASPWKTPYQLWLEKTGQERAEPAGYAADRGNMLEPFARKKYIEHCKIHMIPKTFQKGEYLRASLDGWSVKEHAGVEIKCPMSDIDFKTTLKGQVPDKYKWQLTHQFIVTGAKWLDFFVYYVKPREGPETGEVAVVRVYPNVNDEATYIKAAHKFWEMIQTKTPPPTTEKDFQRIENSTLKSMCAAFIEAKKAHDLAKEKLDDMKNEVCIFADLKGWNRFKSYGVKCFQVVTKGSVDYKKMLSEENVDAEKYRRESKTYYKLEVMNVQKK